MKYTHRDLRIRGRAVLVASDDQKLIYVLVVRVVVRQWQCTKLTASRVRVNITLLRNTAKNVLTYLFDVLQIFQSSPDDEQNINAEGDDDCQIYRQVISEPSFCKD